MNRSLLFFISVIVVVSVFFGALITLGDHSKKASASEKISFSHINHVEKYNIKDCGTCHKYDANKNFRGLPSIGECTVCHDRNGVLTSDDHMKPRKKSIFSYYTDKDRPWISAAENSDIVYYSHKVAVDVPLPDGKTKLRCEPCHADKVSSTGTAKTSGEKLMNECNKCHFAFKIDPERCDICHR